MLATPTIVFTTLATLTALLMRIYSRLKPYPVDPALPGPKRSFFFGILKIIIANWENWPEVVHKYSEHFQKTWGGPVPYLGSLRGAYFVLTDERNIEYILSKNYENYEKGELFRNAFRELLGHGIFAEDGATWYRHRKIASRMFSTNLLREASAVTLKKVEELTQALTERGNETIDIQDFFFRMTFDITSVTSFGVDYGSIKHETQHPFALAFDEMQELLLERMRDPLFAMKRYFNMTKREQRIRELKVILDSNAREVIQSRRRTAQDGGGLGADILSRFIEYANSNNDEIPEEELRDVIMNIQIAGRDTTACALSWTIYELTKHPEVVEKLIQEANKVCGKIGEEKEPDYSYNTIGKLQYTQAVVLEVLRLHPSVPSDAKYAIKDDVLPDGTFIPKQAMVGYPPYAMGRSTLVWGKDANEFKPERFMGTKEPSAFRYPVFNAGKRLCLGKPMAINTLKLTLAYLVPRFEFQDATGHDGTYNWTLVMKMNGGFPVKVSARK